MYMYAVRMPISVYGWYVDSDLTIAPKCLKLFTLLDINNSKISYTYFIYILVNFLWLY